MRASIIFSIARESPSKLLMSSTDTLLVAGFASAAPLAKRQSPLQPAVDGLLDTVSTVESDLKGLLDSITEGFVAVYHSLLLH